MAESISSDAFGPLLAQLVVDAHEAAGEPGVASTSAFARYALDDPAAAHIVQAAGIDASLLTRPSPRGEHLARPHELILRVQWALTFRLQVPLPLIVLRSLCDMPWSAAYLCLGADAMHRLRTHLERLGVHSPADDVQVPFFEASSTVLSAMVGEAMQRVVGSRSPVMFEGERGTGRRAALERLRAARHPGLRPAVIECEGSTLDEVLRLLGDTDAHCPVLLADIDRLPRRDQQSLASALAARRSLGSPWLYATAGLAPKLADDLTSLFEGRVHVPPLCAALRDLPALCAAVTRAYQPVLDVALDVGETGLQRLRGHTWPGNLRELRDILLGLMILSAGGIPTDADLFTPPALLDRTGPQASALPMRPPVPPAPPARPGWRHQARRVRPSGSDVIRVGAWVMLSLAASCAIWCVWHIADAYGTREKIEVLEREISERAAVAGCEQSPDMSPPPHDDHTTPDQGLALRSVASWLPVKLAFPPFSRETLVEIQGKGSVPWSLPRYRRVHLIAYARNHDRFDWAPFLTALERNAVALRHVEFHTLIERPEGFHGSDALLDRLMLSLADAGPHVRPIVNDRISLIGRRLLQQTPAANAQTALIVLDCRRRIRYVGWLPDAGTLTPLADDVRLAVEYLLAELSTCQCAVDGDGLCQRQCGERTWSATDCQRPVRGSPSEPDASTTVPELVPSVPLPYRPSYEDL